ncbi:PucR family transcriptional regulator [Angustibacter sp. McL0619]|uniref:PucR family transcriptional regulator n=1 Tax=Angustibacter sp. McL0619 TaxID=3415676 RepID=UPI003CF8775A
MLLGDLLANPELELRLLHGDDAALSRPLRWVYTTDLLDPSQYLSGGELVMTGLVWRHQAADSERFVSAIAAAGAAALAAGDALFGSVPADVVAACRRHGLALLEVPTHVSFGDITERVVAAVAGARGDRLAMMLGRQRQLLSLMAEGRGLDELTTRVHSDTGLICRILTPTGREVTAWPQPLGDDELDRLTHAFLAADRLPAVTPAGEPPYSLFAVGPGLGHRTTSWMVAAQGVWTDWDVDVADVVNELAAIAALDRGRREEGLHTARSLGGPDALRRSDFGGPGEPLHVLVAGFADRDDLVETARAVLDDVAAGCRSSLPARVEVLDSGEHVAAVLLPARVDGVASVGHVRKALGRLRPGVVGTRLAVGIGGPTGADSVGGALDEAGHAYRVALGRHDPVDVVAGDEVTSSVLLLASVPDDVRRAFARRVLGPVLDYDGAHDADLRRTLQAFLDCSGAWNRTAAQLHLHVNTVRYRITRVEELTGRDLTRLEDRVDLFLALRSL